MQSFCENSRVVALENIERHVIATIDIAPGDVIAIEQPLFVFNDSDYGLAGCSKCFKHSSNQTCSKCHTFSLCPDCKEHDAFECEFICKTNTISSPNPMVCSALLKLLLLLENPRSAQKIEFILKKPIDLDGYRDSEEWKERASTVVEPMLRSAICDQFARIKVNADLLQILCICIDEYSFDIANNEMGKLLRGMYLNASILTHNCVPNTVISIADDFQMQVYASLPIKQGDIIYNSYANPLMGTSQRQHHLKMTKRIDCKCIRCMDPTELGTHMSSMKCRHCVDGYAVCQQISSNNEHFICLKCSSVIEVTQVDQLLAEVGEEMVFAAGDVQVYEMLLAKYSTHFHPNHFLIIDIKQNIAAILQAIAMSEASVSSKQMLRRKIQINEEILPIFCRILPGISKPHSEALCEYFFTFLHLAEIELNDGEISVEEYLKRLRRAKEIGDEVAMILIHEPSNSRGGRMREDMRLQGSLIEEDIQMKTIKLK